MQGLKSSEDNEPMLPYPNDLREQVDHYLCGLRFDHYPRTGGLNEAMRYPLLAGGKRIRPVLALATARALDLKIEKILPVACAVELIHTTSLVCDDLPAMDNHKLRRDRPALHLTYGEGVAMLAGYALYTEAIHLIEQLEQPPEKVLALIREIVRATSTQGMASGQYLDVANEEISGAELRLMHELKTGSLIEAAVRCMLVMAELDEVIAEHYRRFAKELGVLHQIVDDVLDVTATQQELGKIPNNDRRLGRNTYVSFYGLEQAQELAMCSYKLARAALKEATKNALGPTDDLFSITEYIYKIGPQLQTVAQ